MFSPGAQSTASPSERNRTPGTAVRVTPTTSYSPRTGNITVDNSW